jgi:hypothetical protein
MRDSSNITEMLQKRYIRIEHTIQSLWPSVFSRKCAACTAICCRPHMADSVLESPWLHSIAARAHGPDWHQNGTHPLCHALTSSGCLLREGKPPFCYGFYCDDLLEDIPPVNLVSYLYLSNILSALCMLDKDHHLLELSEAEQVTFADRIDRNLSLAESQLARYRNFREAADSDKPGLALRMVAEMPRILSRSVCQKILGKTP